MYFPSLPYSNWFKGTFAYADVTYIMNPEELSDVQTDFADEPALNFGGDKGLRYNSIADQWLARMGVSQIVWPSQGVSVSAGVRWEGVPVYDAIGGSDGFRFSGWSASFEPGVTWSPSGKDSFSVFVPVAFHRHADKPVVVQRLNLYPGPGVATIADWQLVISYTHTF